MASLSWADRAAMAAGEPEPSAPIMTRSATQFAMQAAERAKSQPQGEAEAAFLAAIDRIFARWTLLQLAVDMGWGDGNGAKNIQYLKEDCLDWLQKRKPDSIEPSDLELLLSDFVNDFFHTIAEDGSCMEVAVQIVNVYRQCASGDLTLARQIMMLPLPQQSSTSMCQAGAEPDELNGDMSDDDDAEDNSYVPSLVQTMGAIAEDQGAMEDTQAQDSEWTTVAGKKR